MADQTNPAPTDEPIGIIIAWGGAAAPAPRVASYEWQPVPDESPAGASRAA